MAKTSFTGISIGGIVNVLPEARHDNMELGLLAEKERAHFVEVTGIRYRHLFEAENQIVSLFHQGVEQLLINLGWQTNDVDALICVTQTAQANVPAVSCKLHGNLGFKAHTIVFDINLGCSGYTYGLGVIYALLSGLKKDGAKAILCCGDISSQLIEATDKTTVPIFSDAISVTGIEYRNDNLNTADFCFETFGSGQKAIYTEHKQGRTYMRLNGIDVFNYSVKTVPPHVKELLHFANRTDADVYIFHQANKVINDAIAKKLGIAHLTPSTLHNFGNTASASIPITLHHYLQNNQANNQVALLCGFGVGFSVASALVTIPSGIHTQMLYMP